MRKSFSLVALADAAQAAHNFFQQNPDRWFPGAMMQDTNVSVPEPCYCFAGRMAVELGARADSYEEVLKTGYDVSNALRTHLNVGVIPLNDRTGRAAPRNIRLRLVLAEMQTKVIQPLVALVAD